MSQFRWVLLDDFGKRYNIGLYHGNRTGHVLIYCNYKVLLIDFGVRESKSYSFFLGHELCELTLEEDNGNFTYDLKQNMTINTPLNRLRKKQQNRNMIKVLVIAFLFILSFIFIYHLLTQLH